MSDIEITRDVPGETCVVLVEGLTDKGIEFVDAYIPIGHARFLALDAGRIVIHENDVSDFIARATEESVTVDKEDLNHA